VEVGWALPNAYRTDEVTNLVVETMVRERSVNPEFFNYLSLFFDLQVGVLLTHSALCDVTGACSSPEADGFDELPALDHRDEPVGSRGRHPCHRRRVLAEVSAPATPV
jgi:hypothetical protein